MYVAITGAGSTVARSVIGLLDRDPDVTAILALDIRPYRGISSTKVRYQRADVRDVDSLRSAFTHVDAVIHLAFVVVADVPDLTTIEAVNIGGSKCVLQAAADSGVRKVVYTSSVAAYGAVPGNPSVLTEASPLRGLENERDFYYSYTKAAVESAMDEFVDSHPQLIVTRFRPPIVVGPNVLGHTDNLFFLSRLAGPSRSFWGFRPEGPNGSLLQYVHEEDLAKAIQYALHNAMPGAYNISGDPLDFDDYLRQKGKTFRRIPWAWANVLAVLLSPLSDRARLARSWLVSARYRNIMDSSKLRGAGFEEPLRTTLQCVEEVVTYYEGRRATKAAKSGGQEDSRR